GRDGADLAVGAAIRDLADPELVQPLAAAAARRRGDPDRREVAGTAARAHGGDDRRLLGADPERVRRVRDVQGGELAPVARPDDRADEVVRVRRICLRRRRVRLLDEVAAHAASWKRARAVSVPRSAPSATSSVEWTPDSTRVCATRSAI